MCIFLKPPPKYKVGFIFLWKWSIFLWSVAFPPGLFSCILLETGPPPPSNFPTLSPSQLHLFYSLFFTLSPVGTGSMHRCGVIHWTGTPFSSGYELPVAPQLGVTFREFLSHLDAVWLAWSLCWSCVCKGKPLFHQCFSNYFSYVGLFVSHEAFRTVSFTLQKLQSTVSLLIYVGRISILPLLTAVSVECRTFCVLHRCFLFLSQMSYTALLSSFLGAFLIFVALSNEIPFSILGRPVKALHAGRLSFLTAHGVVHVYFLGEFLTHSYLLR